MAKPQQFIVKLHECSVTAADASDAANKYANILLEDIRRGSLLIHTSPLKTQAVVQVGIPDDPYKKKG